jgi:methyl-accepting chemotaxis protein
MANGKQNGELKSARRPSNGKSTARSRNGSVVLNRDVAAGSAQMVKLDAGGAQLDLKQLLRVLSSVKKGDFTVRLETEENGMVAKIAETLNDVIELNERLTKELERISSVVGKEGKITQRAALTSASGSLPILPSRQLK